MCLLVVHHVKIILSWLPTQEEEYLVCLYDTSNSNLGLLSPWTVFFLHLSHSLIQLASLWPSRKVMCASAKLILPVEGIFIDCIGYSSMYRKYKLKIYGSKYDIACYFHLIHLQSSFRSSVCFPRGCKAYIFNISRADP